MLLLTHLILCGIFGLCMNLSESKAGVKGKLLDAKLRLQGSPLFTPREVRRSTTREKRREVRREIIQETLAKNVGLVGHVHDMDRERGGIIVRPDEERMHLVTAENVAEGMFRRTRPSALTMSKISELPIAEGRQLEADLEKSNAIIVYMGFKRGLKKFHIKNTAPVPHK
jgi:hypothetical protein